MKKVLVNFSKLKVIFLFENPIFSRIIVISFVIRRKHFILSVIPLPIPIGMMRDLLNKNLLTGGRSRVVARDDES